MIVFSSFLFYFVGCVSILFIVFAIIIIILSCVLFHMLIFMTSFIFYFRGFVLFKMIVGTHTHTRSRLQCVKVLVHFKAVSKKTREISLLISSIVYTNNFTVPIYVCLVAMTQCQLELYAVMQYVCVHCIILCLASHSTISIIIFFSFLTLEFFIIFFFRSFCVFLRCRLTESGRFIYDERTIEIFMQMNCSCFSCFISLFLHFFFFSLSFDSS